MSPNDQAKKKSSAPVIPHIGMRKRPGGKSCDTATQKVQKVTIESSPTKPWVDEQTRKIVVVIDIAG